MSAPEHRNYDAYLEAPYQRACDASALTGDVCDAQGRSLHVGATVRDVTPQAYGDVGTVVEVIPAEVDEDPDSRSLIAPRVRVAYLSGYEGEHATEREDEALWLCPDVELTRIDG